MGAAGLSTYSPWILPVALVMLSVVKLRLIKPTSSTLNLPPMPPGLPIIGTMLKTRGRRIRQSLIGIAKEFGPLYALKTGLKYVIVILSSDVAHEALIENSQVFSTRARTVSRMNYTGRTSINAALYGSYWRAVRKNLVTELSSTARVTAFKPFREMELNSLIERIREQAKKNDNVVPVLSNCRSTVVSILLRILFGKTLEASVIDDLNTILRRLMLLFAAPQVIDFLPFIQILRGIRMSASSCWRRCESSSCLSLMSIESFN